MQVPNRILLTVLLLVLTTYQVHAAQKVGAPCPRPAGDAQNRFSASPISPPPGNCWPSTEGTGVSKTASIGPAMSPPVADMVPNGVPIVQIAPPNAAGLSYNRFDSFEVDSIGLIINNSRSDRADYDSQLAGSIKGNPRLQHESAMVILIEVTGSAPSQLRGPIEIAGDKGYGYKTDIIIVNPNGLVIDGVRFINIARMTLSTGRPTFNDNGDLQWPGLQTLNVIGGDIIIERGGLDARGADSVDLYAQALKLNEKLYAHTLSLRLGSQSIDYRSGVATPNEAPNQHQMLLDSSALGGMYADRITLVGSGVGLWVRLPPKVVTLSGEIQISVEGEIYDYPNPLPPDHDTEPPDHDAEPPDHGAEPPDHDAEPPDHGAEPPDHDAEPPDHEAEPPDHDAEPPDHDTEPPDHDTEPPDHDTESPDHDAGAPPQDGTAGHGEPKTRHHSVDADLLHAAILFFLGL